MSKIVIVGEAYGEKEEEVGKPFVGPSGWVLDNLLAQAGIDRNACYLTNVFNLRPQPKNDVANLCGPKTTALPGYPPLSNGKYVRMEYAGELSRLYAEIRTEAPTLILAFGATAAWALLGTSGIKKIRGAPLYTSGSAAAAVGSIKVLPTYHPAAVMREWKIRPIVLADLYKAARESEFPEIRRPIREIWVDPTLADLADFDRRYIDPSPDLSVDIETAAGQLTCIGFAPDPGHALVVPFIDPTQSDGNYWRSYADERAAWRFVVTQLHRGKAIVGQNFIYDMHYLWRTYGISVPDHADDTMLLHHALQPEMEKSLGFLGSVYTDEVAWKWMRDTNETLKQED